MTEKLTATDGGLIAAEGLIKAIPFAGESLSTFIFGPLAELRWKRVEKTLKEIDEAVKNLPNASVVSEEFAGLIEQVGPQVARSVSEERRIVLKNLLLNAATIPAGRPKWDEAALMAEIVRETDTPGLNVLAALSQCTNQSNYVSCNPSSRVYDGGTEWKKPTDVYFELPYEWTVVEEWCYRLKERRLIGFNSGDHNGGFGGVYLTPLAKRLVAWTTTPP